MCPKGPGTPAVTDNAYTEMVFDCNLNRCNPPPKGHVFLVADVKYAVNRTKQ